MSTTENKTAAYAIFPIQVRVEDVLRSLNLAGFANENICLFLTPAHPIAESVRSLKIEYADNGKRQSASTHVVGWLSQFGAVVIPGVGFFVGSREFVAALTPRQRRIGRDGDDELMTGLGIPQPEAARYQSRVREDATMVFVSCDGLARSYWAREILWQWKADEVSLLDGSASERRVRTAAAGRWARVASQSTQVLRLAQDDSAI